MKVTYSLILSAALCLAPASAHAQGSAIAGKWTGELPAAQGRGVAQPVVVELKLEGETLSGNVIEGVLASRPIANAAVEGNTFSFRTTQNFGGQDIVVNWFGEVTGDSLALTRGVGPTVEAPAGGGRGGGAAGGGRGGGGGGARGAAPAPAAGGAPAPTADQELLAGTRGAANPAAPAAGAARGGAQGGAPPPAAGAARGAAGAPAGAAAGGRGGAAAGGRGGQAGGGRGGGAAAPAGVTRVNGGITLALKRSA